MNRRSSAEVAVATNKFFEEHSAGTKLLRVATQDYAASRCLLLNLLFPGLIIGAQAIEKYLKAYLLLYNPRQNMRELGHSLPRLLTRADAVAPRSLFARFQTCVEKFDKHYLTRYPDNIGASTNMSTADIIEMDELIILINETLPCPIEVKYKSGLYAAITFSLQYGNTVTPIEFWIKRDNGALRPLLPRIEQDYRAVDAVLHPQTQQA